MNYKRLFKWLPTWLLLSIIVMVIISSFDGVIYAEIIGRIAGFSSTSTVQDVVLFTVWAVVLRALIFFASHLGWVLKARAVKLLNIRLKENFFKHFLSGQANLSESEAVSTLTNDYKLIESKYFTPFFEVFTYAVMLLTSVIYMLSIHFVIGLGFLVLSFGAFLPAYLYDKRLKQRMTEVSETSQDFVVLAKDTVAAQNEVRVYRSERQLMSYLKTRISEMENKSYRYTAMSTAVSVSSSFFSFFGRFIPVIFGLYLIVTTDMAPQSIIAMFVASDRIDFPLRMISSYVSMIRSTKPLRDKVEIVEDEMHAGTLMPITEPINIVLDSVTFAHEHEAALFQQLSLTIPSGAKRLLVGPSGSGKSTLLALIQGRLQPQLGQVRYERANGKVVPSIQDRGAIAIIAQQPVVFRGSLRFNLSFDKPEISDAAMLHALAQVNLIDELGSLDFIVEEGGVNLSGGQKQRIEIARALVHNPQVILADEMTAALDNASAEKIRDVIWRLPATVIEVAHHYRPSDLAQYGIELIDVSHLN